jgi:hypothetical protein
LVEHARPLRFPSVLRQRSQICPRQCRSASADATVVAQLKSPNSAWNATVQEAAAHRSPRRRRFAKAARNHSTGLKSMISGSFFIGNLVGVGCRRMVLGPRLGTLWGTLFATPMCAYRAHIVVGTLFRGSEESARVQPANNFLAIHRASLARCGPSTSDPATAPSNSTIRARAVAFASFTPAAVVHSRKRSVNHTR